MSEEVRKKSVELDANINPDLNHRFREIVYKKYGYKRGAISKAVEEALIYYVQKYEKKYRGMQRQV
jgi:hypothetical protein